MLETITSVNGVVNGIVWGPVGLALLFGTGFVMSVRTGFFQFGHFRYWLRNTIGAIFTNRDITAHTEKDDKAISQFQSLCTALAATIGTGNIVGVATAILSGGPGAIFWMWAMAILGMMTNYSENVLGIFYRRKNADGEWSGGAMYYLADGLGSKKGCKKLGRVLAVLFACSYVLSGAVTRPVDRAWQQQKQFLSDASHELKTPLTVILSSAELLEQSAAPEQKQYVDNVRAESRRMKRLVEDMLTLSRVERGGEHLPDTTADLSDAAADAALRFEPVAYEAGHTLSYDIAPGLLVRGDSGKLEQAVAVLLDNAIKYAAPGTEVRLDAARQGKNACLWVENEGDPIPADKLPHIFDRFYRADASRTDGGSFGLGLPIARAIVEAHRGTLRCDSGGHTTRFTITLPCRQGK